MSQSVIQSVKWLKRTLSAKWLSMEIPKRCFTMGSEKGAGNDEKSVPNDP